MKKGLADSPLVVLCGRERHEEPSSVPASIQWTSIQFPDPTPQQSPANSGLKYYWLRDGTIFELQGIDQDVELSSFFVNGLVVKNGRFHIMTPVDPLFLVLATTDGTDSSWKPLDQVFTEPLHSLTDKAREILLALIHVDGSRTSTTTLQYTHILESLELSDDELVYKVSPAKVMKWLHQKQLAAEVILREQEQRNRQAVVSTSFAEGFVMGGNDDESKETKTSVEDGKPSSTARDESIQIVCQYLSTVWRDRFFNYLNVSSKDVLEEQPKIGSKKLKEVIATDWNAGLSGETSGSTQKETKKTPAVTAGAKRLQKVNTKGMSKLSSFFKPKST